jgi:hypothetical protein
MMIRSRKVLDSARGAPCSIRLPGICNGNYDVGHGTRPLMSDLDLLEQVLGAVCETWVSLIASGIVIVPLDAEKHAHERPVKPRKPVEQRAKIASNPSWPEGRKMQSRNDLRRKEHQP